MNVAEWDWLEVANQSHWVELFELLSASVSELIVLVGLWAEDSWNKSLLVGVLMIKQETLLDTWHISVGK